MAAILENVPLETSRPHSCLMEFDHHIGSLRKVDQVCFVDKPTSWCQGHLWATRHYMLIRLYSCFSLRATVNAVSPLLLGLVFHPLEISEQIRQKSQLGSSVKPSWITTWLYPWGGSCNLLPESSSPLSEPRVWMSPDLQKSFFVGWGKWNDALLQDQSDKWWHMIYQWDTCLVWEINCKSLLWRWWCFWNGHYVFCPCSSPNKNLTLRWRTSLIIYQEFANLLSCFDWKSLALS